MEKNKTRGYLPIECVTLVLQFYKGLNEERNKLLNQIELIGYLKTIHLNKRCDRCNKHFIKCNDNNFIEIVMKLIEFNRDNIKITKMLFPSFSDIYDNIGDIKMHDMVWCDRFHCKECGYLLCSACRADAEYPIRYIDLEHRCVENDTCTIICPLCKAITKLNEYLKILQRQYNDDKQRLV